MLRMLERVAALDFSETLTISDRGDGVDAIASGLNMLSEELRTNVVEKSELEAVVAELEVANQALEVFSDSIVHDLRTPLLTVTQFSEHLAQELTDSLSEQQQNYLRRIRAAGRQMTHIIEDLRDLSDVQRAKINHEEVDLSWLGHEIISELRAVVPDREVRFEAEPRITAVGDVTLLRLLSSSLKCNTQGVHSFFS